jgi:hypothetical protein
MNSIQKDIRCRACGVLLAKLDETGLSIRRGDLQATIDGTFRASVVCYKPGCRTLTILNLSTERQPITAGPAR